MNYRLQFHRDHRSIFKKESRCPECGNLLVPEGRCRYCRFCGFSSCFV